MCPSCVYICLIIAYSTTANMNQIMAAHNAQVLRAQKPTTPALPCNCRRECPLSGEPGCRNKAVIYRAEIQGATYVGQTQTLFRERVSRHRTSFKYKYKESETALSKFIWDKEYNMRDGQIVEPEIKWSILSNCRLYAPGDRACNLCTTEKLMIIKYMKSPKCINKKTDLSNKCTHRKDTYYSKLSEKNTSDSDTTNREEVT